VVTTTCAIPEPICPAPITASCLTRLVLIAEKRRLGGRGSPLLSVPATLPGQGFAHGHSQHTQWLQPSTRPVSRVRGPICGSALTLQDILKTVENIATEAGHVVKTAYASDLKRVHIKNGDPTDLVTETDRSVERLIVSRLSAAYPSFKYARCSV